MDERLIHAMQRRADEAHASAHAYDAAHHSSDEDGHLSDAGSALHLRHRAAARHAQQYRSDSEDGLNNSDSDNSVSEEDDDDDGSPEQVRVGNSEASSNFSSLLDRALQRSSRPPAAAIDDADGRGDAEWLWRSPVINPSGVVGAAGGAGAGNPPAAAGIMERSRLAEAAQWSADAASARARAELAQQAAMQQRFQMMQQQQQLQREQLRFQQLQQLELSSARLGLSAPAAASAASIPAAGSLSVAADEYNDLSASKNSHVSSSSGGNGASNSSSIEDLLRCFMCYGRVTQPHLCPQCSKIGCLGCWASWFGQAASASLLQQQQQQNGNQQQPLTAHHSCPCCRRALSIDKLVNARFMADLTAALGELGVVEAEEAPAGSGSGKAGVDKTAEHGRASGSGANSAHSSAAANKPARHKGIVAAGSAPCPSHPSQQMSYFCVTCSVPLCSDCALFDAIGGGAGAGSTVGGGHRGHELAHLDSIYAEHVSLVSSERDKVSARLRRLNSRAESVAKNAAMLQRRRDDAASELAERAAQLEASLGRQLSSKLSLLSTQRPSHARTRTGSIRICFATYRAVAAPTVPSFDSPPLRSAFQWTSASFTPCNDAQTKHMRVRMRMTLHTIRPTRMDT